MNKRDTLTGRLIGLARATFGNDDIITDNTFPLIVKALAAADSEIEAMLTAVEEEKYKIVPDCAVCQVKCGRNEDFDMALLDEEQPEEKQLKLEILETVQKIAAAVAETGADHSEFNPYLAKALMIIGTQDLPQQFLTPVADDGKAILDRIKGHNVIFDYLPGTEQLVRAIWDKNIARHPGDDRWVNWGKEYISNHLTGLAQTFIVTCDGEPVGEGTLLFSPQCSAIRGRTQLADGKTNVNLNALRIEKKYEGQGHISRLVKLMEKAAKEMGYEYITIGVGEDRARNRAIYTHWGYTDLIFVHMEGDEPVLYYRKRL